MGWLSFGMHEPVKEWFTRQWEGEGREVLEVALVKRNTLYAAIKKGDEVFAVIYLIRWSRDYNYNFSYKSMSEHVGPCVIDCPKKVLKHLPPNFPTYFLILFL